MATDPYRYFRIEARELIDEMSQGVLELEKGATDPAIIARLLRHAHTLKGAARVVRQLEIAEHSHQVEEILSQCRDAGQGIAANQVGELLALIDRMGAGLRSLEPALEPAPEAVTTPHAGIEEAFQTVRIEIEEMDAVLRAVTETGVHVSTLRRELGRLRQLTGLSAALAGRLSSGTNGSTAKAETKMQGLAADLQAGLERVTQSLGAGIDRVDQELTDVREGTDRLRLVPAQSLFAPFARAGRDAAQSLAKQVEVQTSGGALRLDAHVLGPLRDALLHLVRNAVAHGIEIPTERADAGKSVSGTVRLDVQRRDGRVVFTCSDDGKGIDMQAVRHALVARGIVGAADASALTDQAVLDRLLSAGLTTTASVTQISGRGVGLDVVRETAARLQGEVNIRSTPGRGTSVELAVPISLVALRALVVEVGTTIVAIPLDSVHEVLRLTSGNIRRSPQGDSVAHGDQVIPFMPLVRALRLAGSFEQRTAWSAVVIGVAERWVAIGVDRLRGTFDVVVRSLPPSVQADAAVAGAFLDAEGNPQLVLDAAGLLAAAERNAGNTGEPARPLRLPILVIDDSLTTRMLEQSILESAGYEVELAVSAEQGLEKARQKPYGLFIVDVEMPGMDGFEFVSHTRADPNLGRVPAILVTSRASDDDLRRGEQAGASAYIIKGEFDQNLLLGSIRRFLG